LIGDFEGEPGGRTGRDHPLRDVAGVLHSFDYMATFGDRRSCVWRTTNQEAFAAGYVAAGGADPAGNAALLDAYLIDTAVYEVVYASRNRPGRLGIPLSAVRRMAR
jgi:maltokinase